MLYQLFFLLWPIISTSTYIVGFWFKILVHIIISSTSLYEKKKFIDGSIISLLSLLPDNMTYWNLHIFNIFMYMSLFWVFIFRVTCLLWSLFCRFYFLCMSIFNFSFVFWWILFFEPIGLPHFMRVSTHFLKLFVGALLAGFCDLVTLFMSVNASGNWFAI